MSSMDLVLSEKYKAFLKCQTPVEFLEGTTAAGKTTVGIFKFMLKVAQSPKKLHILAADDTGTAEKNIINKDLGILDDFGSLVEYNGSGTNKKEWGLARNVFLDSADQATMQEWNKYKRRNGCIYTLNDAWKKMEIIDRINAQLGWMAFDDQTGIEPCFYVLDTCSTYIHEMETYSWKEDKDNTPEDGHDHMVNSVQYAWIPYQGKIYKR